MDLTEECSAAYSQFNYGGDDQHIYLTRPDPAFDLHVIKSEGGIFSSWLYGTGKGGVSSHFRVWNEEIFDIPE